LPIGFPCHIITTFTGYFISMNIQNRVRKPGRPRAIPEEKINEVLSLYHGGLGYRAITRELQEQGLCVDWSTVRRVIKDYQKAEAAGYTNSDTILPLDNSSSMRKLSSDNTGR
jgi:hypothetical protein